MLLMRTLIILGWLWVVLHDSPLKILTVYPTQDLNFES